MILPEGYRLRAAQVDTDLAAAAAILEACDEHDVGFHDPVENWLREDWTGTMNRGVWMVDDASGRPCAFVALSARDLTSQIDGFMPVLPDHRATIRPALLGIIESHARSVARGAPILYVSFSSTDDVQAQVELAGFEHARIFWHMHRPIDTSFVPAEPPAGVTVRPYVEGADDEVGWRLIEEAFRGHFGIDPTPWGDYQADVLGSEMWDPTLASIAVLDGVPVGIVTAYLFDALGWVGDLGVLEAGRRRGIGRALLERSFATLAARGATRLQLNVDSGNETGATRLYEAAGMTVRRSFDCYGKRLSAG